MGCLMCPAAAQGGRFALLWGPVVVLLLVRCVGLPSRVPALAHGGAAASQHNTTDMQYQL